MNYYKKKAIYSLIFITAIFAAAFFIAYLNMKQGTLIFSLGMPDGAENVIVMFLSVVAIGKAVYEISSIGLARNHKAG